MKISQVFYSIQGEGLLSGRAAVFVRFYDCDLACEFCDEPLHKTHFTERTEREVLQEIKGFPSRFVVLTGGEPSLYDLNEFISLLKEEGYFVAVETNGLDFSKIEKADWITYSPKNLGRINLTDQINEIKLIVNVHTKVEQILELSNQTQIPVLVQPQANPDGLNRENTEFCIKLVMNHPFLVLSPQTQKMLDIP